MLEVLDSSGLVGRLEVIRPVGLLGNGERLEAKECLENWEWSEG